MSLLRSMNSTLPPMARASVVSNQDPENHGRVRLAYPWLGPTSADVPSEWARVCMPMASRESGFWMLPEVGDEVLVYFDNGNIESPIVIGMLYSEKLNPPSVGRPGDFNQDGKNDLHFIKSRTGHFVCLDDSSSQPEVIVQHSNGARIILGKDGIEIQSSGKITISSAQSIELGEGAEEALIKGTAFMQLYNTHTHNTAVGPSSPPSIPMKPDLLSKKTKTI